MVPAIFMVILVGGFGVYQHVMLYRENQKLRTENDAMKTELFNFKYVPRSHAEQTHAK
jgi:hypothetical protein